VLALARPHGLVPLLYRHVGTAPNGVPEPVASRLRAAAEAAGRRNLRLAAELVALLDLLGRDGVPAVALKGPALAVRLYGDLALRPCRDLDLLLRPADVPRAVRLLADRGYAPEPPALTPAQQRAFVRSQCHVALGRGDGDIVELHWDLAPPAFPAPLHPERLRTRLDTVTLGGSRVPTLAPDDLLLFLCAHGAKHGWRRLAWLCDVGRFLAAHQELDWPALAARAQTAGAERLLLLALLLAAELLDAPVPAPLLARGRSSRPVRALAAAVQRRLWAVPWQDLEGWQAQWFRVRARERWRDALRVARAAAFAPGAADWALVRLPDRLYALYYVLRPFRLAAKYGMRLWRAARAWGRAAARLRAATRPPAPLARG
jgi:hypothetical protein